MKAIKIGLVGVVLSSFLILLPNTALARSSHRGNHPNYGPREYHQRVNRIDRPRLYHHSNYYLGFRYYYPRTYYYPYGVTTWWGPDYQIFNPPSLIIEPSPVVIEKEVVVVRPEKYNEETGKIFERLRREKAELLQNLKKGDKEERKEAIDKLTGFSFDNQVRKALEDILLSDPDTELRQEVIKAFAKVKNKEVLPALEKARVEDPDQWVRKEADAAIKKIEGSIP